MRHSSCYTPCVQLLSSLIGHFINLIVDIVTKSWIGTKTVAWPAGQVDEIAQGKFRLAGPVTARAPRTSRNQRRNALSAVAKTPAHSAVSSTTIQHSRAASE